MQERANLYLSQLNKNRSLRSGIHQAILILSFLVILAVFWGLKLTGITMAGEAFCGRPEHEHTSLCRANGCAIPVHIHDTSCYSDLKADLESPSDWLSSLGKLPQSNVTADQVVAVAKSQLGCGESSLNFQVDRAGIRRGITRYGQWYGNPYGDWSAMFVSFCLSHAGTELPANAGVESMRLEWVEAGLYRPEAQYAPRVGDVLFITDDGQKAHRVAIITGYDAASVTVIQGDVDGAVAQLTYSLTGGAILGYGTVPQASGLTILANAPDSARAVARTTAYSASMLTSGDSFLLYATSGDRHYAIDGYGNAVEVFIESDGSILADVADPNMLLWTFSRNGTGYVIRNVSTGRHLHPFYNSQYDNGVITSGGWTTSLTASGNGVLFHASAYAQFNPSGGNFVMTRTQSEATVFRFGVAKNRTLWFDGTNGGLMSLGGSPNTGYTVLSGSTVKLPSTWQAPDKYAYALRGWYDIINHRYYEPGAEVTVTENMVFYADWMAQSYDVGQFNSQVTDTVSTNHFVTTRMFDYGVLFNVLSQRADVTVSNSSHAEVWNLLTSGTNPYNGETTLNFIFRDWDRGNEDISYPKGHNDRNNPTSAGTVYPGLYSDHLGSLLFDPELEVIGKQYLGQGDHLFQLCLDPSDPHYGYYYYNSELNAASYNQSQQRFYVYDYLECTRDSTNSGGVRADFLPLNSPYANTNDKLVATYSDNGLHGEYAGTTHYMYDSKYTGNGNTTDHVGTNYWFGMSVDIDFFLPQTPGTLLSNGSYGNQDIYGGDMHFQFTGDDDVWVLVDGQLVLDLGGVHGRESGDVNFSTGIVTINGEVNNELSNTLRSIQPGDHTLTFYYLERGSSLSNCAIYFNLAPRFQFSIQKEDTLTRELLNGAQFSIFTDAACTKPAQLWTSIESYYNGDASRNVFTVVNGSADMWGLISGETYYIKETRGPDALGYACANGIICLTIDKNGVANYHVEVTEDHTGQLSVGFTVHGIKIDEQTQKAFIVATNAPASITEATSVQVHKVWNDSKDHSGDYITVYLTVTDPDGTVRRIREVILSQENNWHYLWENLPKYDANGNLVQYGVSESTVPGYVSKVEKVEAPPGGGSSGGSSGGVSTVTAFENGGTYLLNTKYGFLAAQNDQLSVITTLSEAQNSDTALWIATVNSDGTVTLKNRAGQTLYYDNYAFRAGASPGTHKNLRFADNLLYCFIDHGGWSETQYPVDNDSVVSNLIYNHILYTTNNSAQALQIQPQKQGGSQEPEPSPDTDSFFRITNTPAGDAVTSLTVTKHWDVGEDGTKALYEELVVTIRLLANGADSGLTCQLSLRNNWRFTFENLPLYDSNGQRISYSVQEEYLSDDWHVTYGPVLSSGGSHPTFSVTVTNTYRLGGPIMPSTGTASRMIFILCGTGIMLLSLVYGFASRRKRERGMK